MSDKLPEEGQVETCKLCGHQIVWEFDDPDPSSDNPYGLWFTVEHGWDVCPATDENADDQQHQPTEEV